MQPPYALQMVMIGPDRQLNNTLPLLHHVTICSVFSESGQNLRQDAEWHISLITTVLVSRLVTWNVYAGDTQQISLGVPD